MLPAVDLDLLAAGVDRSRSPLPALDGDAHPRAGRQRRVIVTVRPFGSTTDASVSGFRRERVERVRVARGSTSPALSGSDAAPRLGKPIAPGCTPWAPLDVRGRTPFPVDRTRETPLSSMCAPDPFHVSERNVELLVRRQVTDRIDRAGSLNVGFGSPLRDVAVKLPAGNPCARPRRTGNEGKPALGDAVSWTCRQDRHDVCVSSTTGNRRRQERLVVGRR